MAEIPMPPDNRPVAEQPALDAARNDGGLRIAIACAIQQKDEPPWAAAQSSGFVYETADRVARVVEAHERDLRAQIVASLRRAAAGRREYAERTPKPTPELAAKDKAFAEIRGTLLTEADCYEACAYIIEDPRNVMSAIPSWRWTDEEVASLYPPKETTDG